MKTIRYYTIWLEFIGILIVIFSSFLLYNALKTGLIERIIQDQRAQINEINHYIDVQFKDSKDTFEIFVSQMNFTDTKVDAVAQSIEYMTDFSDVYLVDQVGIIDKVIKKSDNSIIFEGYQLSGSQIGKFLFEVPIDTTKVSQLIRSSEMESLSAYVVHKKASGYLVARLSLDKITELLTNISEARDVSVTVVSNAGYVLSSTETTLPFEVAPDNNGLVRLKGTDYIVVRDQIESLKNDLVLLVPYENVSQNIQLMEIWFPIVLLLFIVLMMSKIIFLDIRISKPLRQFSDKLSSWTGEDDFKQDNLTTLKTVELHKITEAFISKSSEINAYIEELYAVNEELKNREAQYRDLVENVENLILSFDLKGKIITFNQAFSTAYITDEEKCFEKTIFDYCPLEDQKKLLEEKLQLLKDTKSKVVFNFKYLTFSKTIKHYKTIWIPRFDEFGQIEQILASQTDISELILAQDSLKKIFEFEKNRLEDLVDEKDEALTTVFNELVEKEKLASLGHLVSGISHEVNTPLGVSVLANSYLDAAHKNIKMQLEVGELTLEDLKSFLDKVDETIRILDTNLKRAVGLVKSFKEIAVSQNIEEKSNFNISEFIDMVMLSLKHEYKNRPIQFEIDCPKTLEIKTYSGVISQILTNLIMNSLNHAFDIEDSGIIRLVIHHTATITQIIFEDDGKGMAPEVVDKIFEPFFTTNRKKGGSGLGMNIVYNLVTGVLGGRIKCTSALGKGTRFEIEFSTSKEL